MLIKRKASLTTLSMLLVLASVVVSLVLSACGNDTNGQSTVASQTVDANNQAYQIKPLPTDVATTAPAGGGSGATTAPAAGGGSTDGDAKAGLVAFQSASCSGCHSNNGQAAGVGPKLQGDPKTADVAFTKDWVRNKAVAPMPKFSTSQLSDADLNNIAAYLKALR